MMNNQFKKGDRVKATFVNGSTDMGVVTRVYRESCQVQWDKGPRGSIINFLLTKIEENQEGEK